MNMKIGKYKVFVDIATSGSDISVSSLYDIKTKTILKKFCG